ncbi:hypothetical protein Poly41_57790 [Novipirellula artificiosorum]|uniref:Uncharacterized protein n=1 Tax=Novipirellula artificiosorum TaxID=2528016 RepID=A0A5C6D565_9BACT|nr:hypothetical protein Poly41_57790 [Novipirellula artificiosorum]
MWLGRSTRSLQRPESRFRRGPLAMWWGCNRTKRWSTCIKPKTKDAPGRSRLSIPSSPKDGCRRPSMFPNRFSTTARSWSPRRWPIGSRASRSADPRSLERSAAMFDTFVCGSPTPKPWDWFNRPTRGADGSPPHASHLTARTHERRHGSLDRTGRRRSRGRRRHRATDERVGPVKSSFRESAPHRQKIVVRAVASCLAAMCT